MAREVIRFYSVSAEYGEGGDGSGRNELGRVLMAVRTALRAEQDD